jgi:8-oxo-dGTP pyrophosphatase MutT (NUDIX family)/RimJ/RimL family protein N-acetyltransferase
VADAKLEKMAIANIAPGKRLPGGEFSGKATFDYSHVVPEEHRGSYQIHVQHDPKEGEWQAHLLHTTPGFAPMKIGTLDSEVEGNGIAIGFARIGKDDNDFRHRGKGLGPAMYEALLAHAKHHLKLKHVVGNVHSSMASSVHRKLAAKHGMDYEPKPNYKQFEGGKKEWSATPPGPFDKKFGPYFYTIKSELRKKESDKVASVAVFNSEGRLLFGRRNDNNLWTLPGGHFEVGETPEAAARRELKEEAGFNADQLEHLGEDFAGRNNDKQIYAFSTTVNGNPDASADPDAEIGEWKWVDVSGGLPAEIRDNLHSPKNVTLRLLNLQEGSMEKSLKEKFLAVAAAGAMVASPAAAQNPDHLPEVAYNQSHAAEWKPQGLHKEMHPIAHLESSFGKRLQHLPHSQGEFNSSFGAVGMKPVTAHETYMKSKGLQKLFPDLHEPDRFLRTFKTDPVFYNTVASTHWTQLKKLTGGNLSHAAYAWRWGAGKMARTPPELIAADPYVQAFDTLTAKLAGQQPITKSVFEKAVGEWLQKKHVVQLSPNGLNVLEADRAATDTGMQLLDAFGAKPPNVLNTKRGQYRIYDMADDPFTLFHPRARQTTHGIIYEPVDLEHIKARLKQLGYHAYRGRSLDPNTFVFFADPTPEPAGEGHA